MTENIKFSIIIPVYNVEAYLVDCLDSVFEQTYTNYEVICVEDVSTDSSLALLRQYPYFDQIRLYINDTNQGLSYSRNRGIAKAEGEYIIFLDSDDYISPDLLETLADNLNDTKWDFITFDSELFYEANVESDLVYNPTRKNTYNDVHNPKELYIMQTQNGDYKPTVWQYCYNREFLLSNNIEFENGKYNEDEEFSAKVFISAVNALTLSKRMHFYRIRRGSIMSGVQKRTRLIDNIESYASRYKFMIENKNSDPLIYKCAELQNERWANLIINTYKKLDYIEKKEFDEIIKNDYFLRTVFREILGRSNEKIFCKEMADFLESYSKIYIFGAGKFAYRSLEVLKKTHYNISGIIVSDMCNNPDEIAGIKVDILDNIVKNEEDFAVIIGITEKNQKEVIELLNRRGIYNIIGCQYLFA